MIVVQKIPKKLIIIKYGSSVLVKKNTQGDVGIDTAVMEQHGQIINEIHEPVIIVSSGAVAFGNAFKNPFPAVTDSVLKKRLLAALGNPRLSIAWDTYIKDKNILQSLLTHRDLLTQKSKQKIAELLYVLFSGESEEKNIIQVNDNDFVTDEELVAFRGGDFGDNDEIVKLLVFLCTGIFESIEVVINTSADGVLKNEVVVPTLTVSELTDGYIEEICGGTKTDFGTGGMENKLKTIRDLLQQTTNVSVHIVNGKHSNALKQVLGGVSAGTHIFS